MTIGVRHLRLMSQEHLIMAFNEIRFLQRHALRFSRAINNCFSKCRCFKMISFAWVWRFDLKVVQLKKVFRLLWLETPSKQEKCMLLMILFFLLGWLMTPSAEGQRDVPHGFLKIPLNSSTVHASK